MEMKMFIFFKLQKNVSENPDATHSVKRGIIFTDKSTF
jgi:hypothetical protein